MPSQPFPAVQRTVKPGQHGNYRTHPPTRLLRESPDLQPASGHPALPTCVTHALFLHQAHACASKALRPAHDSNDMLTARGSFHVPRGGSMEAMPSKRCRPMEKPVTCARFAVLPQRDVAVPGWQRDTPQLHRVGHQLQEDLRLKIRLWS